MMKRLTVVLCGVAALMTAGCEEDNPIEDRPIPVLETLAVEAAPTTVAVGEKVVFKATGTLHHEATPDQTFEDDLTSVVLWESSDALVIQPGADGHAIAKAAGTVTIRARTPAGGAQGAGIASDPVNITVTP